MCDRVNKDNWDVHWKQHDFVNEINPGSKYRTRLISKLLKIKEIKGNLIDFGSGTGQLLKNISNENILLNCLGMENSHEGIALSKQRLPDMAFCCVNLQAVQDCDKYKNWAHFGICSEVLEHLDKPELALESIKYYLAEDAQLLISVPGSPRSAFDRHIGHRKHYKAIELEKILSQCGFKDIHIYKAGFPFFNLYKILSILRGEKVITDAVACTREKKCVLHLINCVFVIFNYLMRFNLTNSKFGWQLVAVARKG